MKINNLNQNIKLLRDYFYHCENVSMAFVFGSYAQGREIVESDFDVAVYFRPEEKKVEWEESKYYPEESRIWLEIEKIVKRNVDLVVLNRAAAVLFFEILRSGKIIIVKDRRIYLDLLCRISFEAIDFMELVDDYWKIEQRSFSLNNIDKQRLIKYIDFLNRELKERDYFSGLDWQTYQSDGHKRRDVERWVENIVNCSIDIAKVILASEKIKIPDTYKDMLKSLTLLPKFKEDIADQLAEFAKLRNILAHEYLDIKFDQIKKFIQEDKALYQELINFTQSLLIQ